jgi:hypothetical protein
LVIFAHPLEKVKFTALLSQVYERKQAAEDQEAMDVIKGVSPIAWQHVNLFSTFEFNQAASKVDIDALAARYDDPVCWGKAFREEQESKRKTSKQC